MVDWNEMAAIAGVLSAFASIVLAPIAWLIWQNKGILADMAFVKARFGICREVCPVYTPAARNEARTEEAVKIDEKMKGL